MLEKIKIDVVRLILVLIIKKYLVYFAKIQLFFIFETKSILSTFVYIIYTISQTLKTKFYVV